MKNWICEKQKFVRRVEQMMNKYQTGGFIVCDGHIFIASRIPWTASDSTPERMHDWRGAVERATDVVQFL